VLEPIGVDLVGLELVGLELAVAPIGTLERAGVPMVYGECRSTPEVRTA